MLVAAFILGGVVLLGLIILALIKMIIWWISRREVKEWEKERGKNTITSVSRHLSMSGQVKKKSRKMFESGKFGEICNLRCVSVCLACLCGVLEMKSYMGLKNKE